jgi:hypothetical protein
MMSMYELVTPMPLLLNVCTTCFTLTLWLWALAYEYVLYIYVYSYVSFSFTHRIAWLGRAFTDLRLSTHCAGSTCCMYNSIRSHRAWDASFNLQYECEKMNYRL